MNLFFALLLIVAPALALDADGDGYDEEIDCDDTDPLVNPGASEVPGNDLDDDCDGLASCYVDADYDGYGQDGVVQEWEWNADWFSCADGELGAAVAGDCDDRNQAVNPGATEICENETDEDCSGADGVYETLYYDGDQDGFGGAEGTVACELDDPYFSSEGGDCDDQRADRSPGLPEQLGSGLDEDCDGLSECWADDDSDAYGGSETILLPVDSLGEAPCDAEGSASVGGDCRDDDAEVNPEAEELCNRIDDDCDGLTDEGLATETWYTDADGDGWGVGTGSEACAQPEGSSAVTGDCDDQEASVNPDAQETWYDGVDGDCDGSNDYDRDGDGHEYPSDCDDLDGDVSTCEQAISGGMRCGAVSSASGAWLLALLPLALRRRP